MSVRRKLMAALAAAVFLAGCASTPQRPPDAGAAAVSGRLSVQVDAHGQQGARSVNADFDLRGNAE